MFLPVAAQCSRILPREFINDQKSLPDLRPELEKAPVVHSSTKWATHWQLLLASRKFMMNDTPNKKDGHNL